MQCRAIQNVMSGMQFQIDQVMPGMIGIGMHADVGVGSGPGVGEHTVENFLSIRGDLIRVTALPKKITMCAQ